MGRSSSQQTSRFGKSRCVKNTKTGSLMWEVQIYDKVLNKHLTVALYHNRSNAIRIVKYANGGYHGTH